MPARKVPALIRIIKSPRTLASLFSIASYFSTARSRAVELQAECSFFQGKPILGLRKYLKRSEGFEEEQTRFKDETVSV